MLKIYVNNVNLSYEVFGSGKPIVLVHGNGETHKVFDMLYDRLKEDYTVYAVDSRCHGESEDTDEISYDLMAEDIIGFIEALELDKPILYGFSDGGIVGLLVAIKKTELLSKLIISGANITPDGLSFSMLFSCKVRYFFKKNKLVRLMIKEPDISTEELGKIQTPTVVLAGEKDIVREEHTRLIADSIKNSRLEIIPNERHGTYIVHSEKIYDIIKKYLTE